MLKKIKFCFAILVAACVLTACALGDRRPPAIQYDLGPLKMDTSESMSARLPVISTKVHAPEWMNENLMFYRLDYINDQQVRKQLEYIAGEAIQKQAGFLSCCGRQYRNRSQNIVACTNPANLS